MLAMITEWVKNIIIVVLFASFMEMLLPNSSMQRFVRVIMGLLIMLAILNPIVDIIQNRGLPAQVPALSLGGKNPEQVQKNTERFVQERERLTREMYRNDLAKQIRAVVAAIDGVKSVKVSVELQDTSAGPDIAVDKIEIFIQPGVRNSDTVEKVNIGGSIHPEMEISSYTREKVVRTVNELYQVSRERIDVKKMN